MRCSHLSRRPAPLSLGMGTDTERCQTMRTKKAATAVDPSETFLTIEEVASLLRVSVSCVRAWKSARKISFIRPNGKNLLFKRTDIDAFIQRATVPAKRAA
jgi:excisionase family DNA binding protein